jgi:hypothetical protein
MKGSPRKEEVGRIFTAFSWKKTKVGLSLDSFCLINQQCSLTPSLATICQWGRSGD